MSKLLFIDDMRQRREPVPMKVSRPIHAVIKSLPRDKESVDLRHVTDGLLVFALQALGCNVQADSHTSQLVEKFNAQASIARGPVRFGGDNPEGAA